MVAKLRKLCELLFQYLFLRFKCTSTGIVIWKSISSTSIDSLLITITRLVVSWSLDSPKNMLPGLQ